MTSIVSSHCSLVAGVVVLWLHLPVTSGAGPVAAGSAAAGVVVAAAVDSASWKCTANSKQWNMLSCWTDSSSTCSAVAADAASLTCVVVAAALYLVSPCS